MLLLGCEGFCVLAPAFMLQTGERLDCARRKEAAEQIPSKGTSSWADEARVMVPWSKGTWLPHPVSGKLQPESCSGDKSNYPGWKQNKTKLICLSKFRQEALKQDWTHQGLCKKTIRVFPYYLPLLILLRSLFAFWPHVTLSRRLNWALIFLSARCQLIQSTSDPLVCGNFKLTFPISVSVQ